MALLADASNSALISAIFCGVRVEGRSFQGGVKNVRWRGGQRGGVAAWLLAGPLLYSQYEYHSMYHVQMCRTVYSHQLQSAGRPPIRRRRLATDR
jgi:hypothetical protein